MPALQFQFHDLGTAVDELHAHFEEWEQAPETNLALDPFRLQVLKLAVHEWVANLVQHADFERRAPLIRLTFVPNGTRLHCTIEDNSAGFDFQRQLVCQEDSLEAAVPPERGRGLLMMIACTEELTYHPAHTLSDDYAGGDGLPDPGLDRCHRLEFWISANHEPCLDIPF